MAFLKGMGGMYATLAGSTYLGFREHDRASTRGDDVKATDDAEGSCWDSIVDANNDFGG